MEHTMRAAVNGAMQFLQWVEATAGTPRRYLRARGRSRYCGLALAVFAFVTCIVAADLGFALTVRRIRPTRKSAEPSNLPVSPIAPSKPRLTERYGNLPLSFEAN